MTVHKIRTNACASSLLILNLQLYPWFRQCKLYLAPSNAYCYSLVASEASDWTRTLAAQCDGKSAIVSIRFTGIRIRSIGIQIVALLNEKGTHDLETTTSLKRSSLRCWRLMSIRFTATKRPRTKSRASHTDAVLPLPILYSSLYCSRGSPANSY